MAVGDFVNERGIAGSFLMELQSKVHELPATFEYQKGASPTYLQRIDFVPGTILTSSKIATWERAADAFFEVDAIGTADQGENRRGAVPFLFYVSNLGPSVAKRLENSGRIDVEAGHRLKFEVHTLTSPDQNALKDPLGEIRFELSQAACNFESSRRVRIDSRRDVRAITITTTALFRRVGGHLSIRTVLFQEKDPKADQAQPIRKGMTPAAQREDLVIARYDFPLKVGRWMPWIAAGLVSLAAAAAVLKIPESGGITLKGMLLPTLVFVLAMLGIVLGLKNDSKR
ncbi:hypothetical protein IB223_06475 [Pseudoxanthomonas sp. PXM03]|uniref:hypothetical protein n=1 Tax=Pseudoxanthomonas sp. PXM03 TaxID=2769284 RepID=UPI0017841602|nr:hypothetical protein [Pseudoxanthomonas sp. PXM03]MBD9435729.1 hypothetical protein [Pseudoxanthomonas sp. PXM03]